MPIEIKDAEGSIWKREYDTQGNVSKEINPLGQITQYKYNNDSQLIEVIDAKGGVKKIQYNELGQMISYSDCSEKVVTGNMIEMENYFLKIMPICRKYNLSIVVKITTS